MTNPKSRPDRNDPSPSRRPGEGKSPSSEVPQDDSAARKGLPPAARRALQEAAERRAAREVEAAKAESEVGGPAGPEPVRYGDWEAKGRAIDF